MKGVREGQLGGDYIYRVRARRRPKGKRMTFKAKIQAAILIGATFLVGFAGGLYAASQLIGDFIPELAK